MLYHPVKCKELKLNSFDVSEIIYINLKTKEKTKLNPFTKQNQKY